MDFELMFTSFPKLLSATVVTLKLLTVSLFFGLFIGLLFAILRLNKNIFINKFAYGYSYVFRGTPLLVQIFIIYFGLGQIEYLRSTFLWVILKEPYWCAIIAFTLNTGAYTSEILRSAFQTIKPGIIEAGKSLGISNKIIFYKIILPQMLRLAIPNLSNVWQITLKDTSLISVTGLVEIMRQSYIAAGSTRDPLFFYSFAAVLYLLLTYLSMKLINRLEAKYSRGY